MAALAERTKAVLTRLEKVLDEENAALSGSGSRNLGEFSRVKTQCLLELQRPGHLSVREAGSPELRARFQTLLQKLELNRWLLALHLEAAKEIASVIMSVIRDAESDGTYSRVAGTKKVFG
ncbi:MAG: flagellar protein FlgN [Rhodomicrobium sp.]